MSSDDPNVSFSTGQQTSEVSQRRPYAFVFVGDLGAADRLPGLTPVDKQDFAQVLGKARPTVAISLDDPLGGSDPWEFQLSFDALKSFEPAGLLKQIDQGRWRLGVREKAIARLGGSISADDLTAAYNAAIQSDPSLAWLTQSPEAASGGGSAPAPAAAPAGGSVLDMIDEPDDSSRIAADVEKLVADTAGGASRISGGEADRTKAALARLDRELSAIADAVLKNETVRSLETAWRGVKFMVDRMDFREGVRLNLLHATRDDAVDRIIEHVINPAFDGDIPTPGMLVFDFPCANTPADIELLDTLAQHCASLPVPALVPLTAQFFEIKSLRLLKNLPNLSGLVDSWQFAKYRSLRDQPYAKAIAPVVGRFILRPPYTPKESGKDFACSEAIKTINDVVWAYGHIAMAVSAARSFVNNGWPTRMYGAEAGKIEDLPVVDNPNDPQNPWGPGDLLLPDRRLDELPAVGINQLLSIKNNDYCMLMGGVSAARPIKTQENSSQQAALEISLPYQQFANIAGAFLCDLLPNVRGMSEEQIQQKLLVELNVLLGTTADEEGQAVQVGVGANPENPGQTIVQVVLEPPARIVPGGLHIEFGFTV